MHWLWIDYALWAALGIVWVVAAPFARSSVRREPLASRVRFLGLVVILCVLMDKHVLAVPALDARWLPGDAWMGALSVALTAIGLAFAAWARFTLGRNWSGTVTVKQDHELVQRGPYGVTRHPIYSGAVLAAFGTVLAVGTVRALFVVPLLVLGFQLKMRVEERFMSEHFGDAYAAYRLRVKGLIPFVW
jgi:protein-S-isoprenylcysteine O-methyltransferase Ste14